MVLIDAVFINNGGGMILLNYLIEKLEVTDIKVTYLLDERLRGKIPSIKKGNKVLFLKGKLILRNRFYKKNKTAFDKVLCFGNIPPGSRLTAVVYTYFHQLLFVKVPKEINLITKLMIKLKTLVIIAKLKNTDFWIVQSQITKQGLMKKYHILEDEIVKVIPFYPPIVSKELIERKKNSFIYVSNAEPHKNQTRLINGFCKFYDEFKIGELHLTVGNEFDKIISLIDSAIQKEYPIVNHGFVSRDELKVLYKSNEYTIYPSLTESFGLGIIEAIENGCKVLGADKDYMHAVCIPSLTFNPEHTEEIYIALKAAYQTKVKESKLLVQDEIQSLINNLK